MIMMNGATAADACGGGGARRSLFSRDLGETTTVFAEYPRGGRGAAATIRLGANSSRGSRRRD